MTDLMVQGNFFAAMFVDIASGSPKDERNIIAIGVSDIGTP